MGIEIGEEKLRIAQEYESGDYGAKEFCEKYNVKYHNLLNWRKRLKQIKEKEHPSFVRMHMEESREDKWMELRYSSGEVIIFYQPIASDFIKSLVK